MIRTARTSKTALKAVRSTHLSPDAVDVLGAAGHPASTPSLAHLCRTSPITRRCSARGRRGALVGLRCDAAVLRGFRVAEREILELPLALADAEVRFASGA